MNETRFIELLAAYGAELSRWPLEERAEAEHLLEFGSHRLRDLWESERVFDRLLALEKDVPASIALESAILSAAPGRAFSPARRVGFLAAPKWAAGGAIAASLALGFAVGYAAEPAPVGSIQVAPQILSVADAGSAPTLLNMDAGVN